MNLRRGPCLILGLLLCSLLTGCISFDRSPNSGDLSPLEVRALQTRTYEQLDSKTALKVLMDVLQDEEYQIRFGDAELGLIHASKTIAGRLSEFSSIPTSVTLKMDATVNVTQLGDASKIRVSFNHQHTSGFGDNKTAFPVVEPRHYQEFFAKLDRGIFIQKQGL